MFNKANIKEKMLLCCRDIELNLQISGEEEF